VAIPTSRRMRSEKGLIFALSTTANVSSASTKQAYADDLLTGWTDSCGITINTKPNKTEAMLFHPGFQKNHLTEPFCSPTTVVKNPAGEDVLVGLEPITVERTVPPNGAPPRVVNWVKSYRYLGCDITLDLDTTPMLEKKISLLPAADVRFFTGNQKIRNASNVLKTNTMVRSQINYLIGFIPCKKFLGSVDAALRSVGRHVFSIPRGTTNKLVEAEMPGLPSVGVILANCVRMLRSLTFMSRPFSAAPGPSLAAHSSYMNDNTTTFVGRLSKQVDEW
jgi:hypothetical protein